MSAKIKNVFSTEMQNLDAAGLLRAETAVVQTDNMEVRFLGNKNPLSFVGNDLLGWSSNDKIIEVAKTTLLNYGTGSTSSRNSIGTIDIFRTLEEKLSNFMGFGDCIVFPSYYLANIGLFEPLTSNRDTIFIDEMCNPGLFDGARLSNANVVSYKNEDNEDLEYHLKCSQKSRFRIVVTDSVFNSDEDSANFIRVQELKKEYDAITIVDDSLGVGVLGVKGNGTYSHLQPDISTDLVVGSFAYALGNVSGGFVCGDSVLINWLRHTSRSYILSEPISPINAAIVLKVIEILEEDQTVLKKFFSNSEYAKKEILYKNWNLVRSDQTFININVGSTLNAQKMVDYLFERNILVSGLCYPNTPEGASLLRINLSANHTVKQIDKLIDALEEAFKLLD